MAPDVQTIMGFKYIVDDALQSQWPITKHLHDILMHARYETVSTGHTIMGWLYFYVNF